MMIYYLVYNTNGKILRSGMCLPTDLELQANIGETAIEVEKILDDTLYEIIDNTPVLKAVITPTQQELNEEALGILRTNRNYYLNLSDWTQMPDSPLTEQSKSDWAAYRTSLRNLPSSYSQITSIDEVMWPEEPE